MSEFWRQILSADEDTLAILIGCSTAVVISCVAIVAGAWRRVRVTEAESQLKLEMVQRGMSAGDIERVMLAGPSKK